MICYSARYNVNKVEIWSSDLFLKKKSLLLEIEESVEQIAAEIAEVSSLSYPKIIEAILESIKRFKKAGFYSDYDNKFRFFVLKQRIWKDKQEKDIYVQQMIDEDRRLNRWYYD